MKMVHFLVALGVAFLFLLGAVVLRSPDHVQVTIELLKVIIAWPPIFLFLALLFMRRYPTEIRSFLSRAIKVGPLEAQQLPPVKPSEPEPKELTEGASPSVGEAKANGEREARSTPGTVSPGSGQQPQEAQAQESETLPVPRTLLRYLAQDREGWKFQFLNQFLVHSTKSVLAWFAERPSATLEEYDRTWRFSIPEPEQRSRVVDALVQYGLLKFGEDGLEITDEGRRALDYFVHHWPLPFAPPAPMPTGATGVMGPTGPILGNLGFGPPSALESLRRLAIEQSAKPPEPGPILEALLKRQTARKEGTAAPEGSTPTQQKGLLFDND